MNGSLQNSKMHNLKITPKYFDAVKYGIKTFKVRKDDRDFEVGDYLNLREWDNGYTGELIKKRIIYI